jgi:Protein of unknown function (DUF3575).
MTDRIIIAALAMIITSWSVCAQQFSVSTNAVDYANFGTFNAEASVAVARHFTVNVGARYNPWTFGKDSGQMQNRTRTVSAGMRWWPWNIYSGWWLGARGQWEEYNRGGIVSPETEEGDAYGAALSAGYSLMLHRNVNLDFGLGVWGGYKKYKVYYCPTCGKIKKEGEKAFFLPSDLLVSLLFTF